MRFLILSALLLLLACPAAALQWSEILFNPQGNDNGGEFIELSGTESLDGCALADASSTDVLRLARNGTSVILIVEENSTVELAGATIYSAGSAIGNGLGNTADRISISCNGTVLLSMSYNISALEGYREGNALVFNSSSGAWSVALNSTPGVLHESVQQAESPSRGAPACDDLLIITLNTTTARAGDHLGIGILSAGYASFDVAADGLPFSSGDTLTTRTHRIIAPNAKELKIVASARECGGRQRAVRYLRISAAGNTGEGSVPAQPAAPSTPPPAHDIPAVPDIPVAQQAMPAPPAPPAQQAQPLPGEIMNEDANAIPWIASFGIVTVAASTAVFLQLLRRGQA